MNFEATPTPQLVRLHVRHREQLAARRAHTTLNFVQHDQVVDELRCRGVLD